MKIEFIVDGSSFKELIKKVIPSSFSKEKVNHSIKKANGTDNYLVRVECDGKKVLLAKEMSRVFYDIKGIFDKAKLKYYILTDEPSQLFAYKLYPYASEFETKLRKFLYVSLFDLDEESFNKVSEKCKKIVKSSADLSKCDVLSSWTIGDIFDFLFANNDFFSEVKTKESLLFSDRKTSKQEYIDTINSLKENTVWNELFFDKVPDCTLPSYHRNIFRSRNDIMHFHSISYSDYVKSLSLFKKAVKDLDLQIEKGIVLESTEDNVEIVSRSSTYFSSALEEINKSLSVFGRLWSSEILSSIALLGKTYSDRVSETLSALKSIKLPEITLATPLLTPGLLDVLERLNKNTNNVQSDNADSSDEGQNEDNTIEDSGDVDKGKNNG